MRNTIWLLWPVHYPHEWTCKACEKEIGIETTHFVWVQSYGPGGGWIHCPDCGHRRMQWDEKYKVKRS